MSGGVFIMGKVVRMFEDSESISNQNDGDWGGKLYVMNVIVGTLNWRWWVSCKDGVHSVALQWAGLNIFKNKGVIAMEIA